MIEFSELTINDKALFDEYFKEYKPQASELTFTNLFMWRGLYKFRFAEIGGFLCVVSAMDGKPPYAFMPAGHATGSDFGEAISGLQGYFSKNGWQLQFRRITEDELPYFKEYVKAGEDIVFDRNSSDYVYRAEDLIKLAGKKYDGKRNHIKRFKRENEYEYVSMDEEHIDECLRIVEEWCAERGGDAQPELYNEKIANGELLRNFSTLDYRGALLKVNGKYEGFTAGEMLNDNTAVIHIEKANSRVNGLYTMINQQFCENQWNGAKYINREQDLGIEGLRKAKLSYNPVKLINKYTVTLK